MEDCLQAVALFMQLHRNFTKRIRLTYNDYVDDDDDDDDLVTLLALKGLSGRSEENSINKLRKTEDNDENGGNTELPTLLFSVDDFQCHFRLKRETIEAIEALVGKEYVHANQPGRRPLPVRITVLLTVWTLGNQESFRDIAKRFQVAGGHAHRAFMTCCLTISKHAVHYFPWPKTTLAIRKNVSAFNALHMNAFPGVVGCIDATHISIKAAIDERAVYKNQKGFTSIIVQAVCDAKLRFTSVFAGCPGSYSKATVWKNSPLCKSINCESWPGDTYILGSSTYPLMEYLLTPYKMSADLSQKQVHFNAILKNTWSVIGQAFCLLKSRFHRLRQLEMSRIDMIPTVVMTACIIHNICIELDDTDVGVDLDNGSDEDECEDDDPHIPQHLCHKRDNLTNFLFSLVSTENVNHQNVLE